MTGTFTRLTVAGPVARVDLSVPGDVTVAEALRLIGAPDEREPRGWVLEHPVKGPLAPDTSLNAAGIVDGETLYLRPDEDGPSAALSEDAAEDAAAVADASPGVWTPALTRAVSAAVLAVWLGLLGPVLAWRFGTSGQVAAAVGVVAGCALAAAALARRLARIPFATGLAYGTLSLAASFAAIAAAGNDLRPAAVVCCGAVATAIAAAVALWLGPPLAPLTGGVGLAAVFTATWSGAAWLGLPFHRAAAAVALAGIVVIGFLPRLAVEGTGLGRLADRVTKGEAVRRNEVKETVGRARLTLACTLAGIAIPEAVALAVLAGADGAWPLACAAVFSAVLWLRARAFSDAAHVLVPAVAAVTGLVAVAVAMVERAQNPGAATAGAVAVALVLAVCSAVDLPDITRIRLRTVLDRVELLAMIACGPLLLGVYDAYAWAARLGGS